MKNLSLKIKNPQEELEFESTPFSMEIAGRLVNTICEKKLKNDESYTLFIDTLIQTFDISIEHKLEFIDFVDYLLESSA